MKTCSKCKISKPEADFYPRGPKHPGLLNSGCKACRSEQNRLHRLRNLEAKREYDRGRDKTARATASRERRKKNPGPIRATVRRRYREDPGYRLECCLRSRLRTALKRTSGARKSARTFELLGCPAVWAEVHIESLFKPGMTWENYGPVWEVDHVKPCASFDLSDPEQQRICFHWTNLQPLFVRENREKSASYER